MKKFKKVLWLMAAIAFISFAAFVYLRFYYVFGVGVKTGQLNYVVNKGYFFKTYEGKLVQAGFQTESKTGIHSNDFIFSIENDELAKKLMNGYENMEVSLQYKEYIGILPWRGNSKYVVDKIVSSGEAKSKFDPTSLPVNY